MATPPGTAIAVVVCPVVGKNHGYRSEDPIAASTPSVTRAPTVTNCSSLPAIPNSSRILNASEPGRGAGRPGTTGVRDRRVVGPVVVIGPQPSCSRVMLSPWCTAQLSFSSSRMSKTTRWAPRPAPFKADTQLATGRVRHVASSCASSALPVNPPMPTMPSTASSAARRVRGTARKNQPSAARYARFSGDEPKVSCPRGSFHCLPSKSWRNRD